MMCSPGQKIYKNRKIFSLRVMFAPRTLLRARNRILVGTGQSDIVYYILWDVFSQFGFAESSIRIAQKLIRFIYLPVISLRYAAISNMYIVQVCVCAWQSVNKCIRSFVRAFVHSSVPIFISIFRFHSVADTKMFFSKLNVTWMIYNGKHVS